MTLTNIYYLHEIGGKKNQEDCIWPAPGTATAENKIFIVCDGVGGSENGEVASNLIAEYAGQALLKAPDEEISVGYINHLLTAARQNLVLHARAEGLNKDMATTFTLLMLFRDKAFIAWCGDSRVYHIRNGRILYKTSDHSLVNTLVKNGDITEQDALVHPQKHIILKAITGDDSPVEADGEWINDLAAGDYFMLCTDGLLENITDADINEILAVNNGHTDITKAIQQKCLDKTKDNYSMYLLQIDMQQQAIPPKAEKSYGLAWLMLVILAVVAIGFLYFDKKNPPAIPAPAATIVSDSAIATPADSVIKKNSEPVPSVIVVRDSPVVNKPDTEEKKIIPAPLPETKVIIDAAGHKKLLHKQVPDSVYVNPQLLIKGSRAVPKTDSLPKQDKPLN